MASDSLRNKTVKGIGWSAVDNIAQHAVTFIVGIVLARILSPDDYGLIGLVTIFTTISNTIINGGFLSALIRKKDATDDDYNTVFITNLVVSLFLYAILFLCAPLIASFFNRIELVSLVRVASIGVVIGALAIVQRAQFTKRIDFKTQTKVSLIASISSGVIGIAMALLGCGVWSLVAQTLSLNILITVLFWSFNRWCPRFSFSFRSFKELFGYSWKMLLSGLLDSTWKELYQVVVGRFYNSATLGQYTRAKQFSSIFSSNLTNVIQRVTFPVLSEIQDDKVRMASAYRRIIKITMLPSVVCMFLLGATAEPLLYCLIGPKWHEAALYLPYICVVCSLYPLHAINLNMLQVQGRSDLFLILEIVKKIIGLAPLAVGAFVGIIPMLTLSIVVGLVNFFLNSHWSGKMIGYSSFMQLKDVAPSYIIASIVALSVYFIKYLPISEWIVLPLQIVVGCLIFFAACEATGLDEYNELKGMAMPLVKKVFKRC